VRKFPNPGLENDAFAFLLFFVISSLENNPWIDARDLLIKDG